MTGRLHFRELHAQTDPVICNMEALIVFCIENTNAGPGEKIRPDIPRSRTRPAPVRQFKAR